MRIQNLVLYLAILALLASCSANRIIAKYTYQEPLVVKCKIISYYPYFNLNHWIVLQDSTGTYYYVSQPGKYSRGYTSKTDSDHPYYVNEPIKGLSQIFIGSVIQVPLFRYKDHPRNFHLAERSCHGITLDGEHTIRTQDGWVENIFYCPIIELTDELMYLNDK